jgi:hypothetical protein
MMDDYFTKFYYKLAKRHGLLMADNYKVAKEIAAWKENIAAHWDEMEVVSKSNVDMTNFNVGDKFNKDLFESSRVTTGPIIAFLGFVLMAFAIIYRKKDNKPVDENNDEEKA